MTLALDITHALGAFRLDARFETAGELVALFGRSGSGKTALVNTVAGLIRPDRGKVVLDGTTLVDTERGLFVPPHKRRIGYVFQEGRLLPHLSVRHNLLYGRWFTPPAERRAGFDEVIDLLGLAPLLERRPGRLSGGEKQRVAIGRALLADPRLLLMDEPLAALDEARKAEILPFIERLRDHARVPIVYVSHSIGEVTRLASTIVLMSDGRVAAVGETSVLMQRLDLFPLTGRAEAGAVVEAIVEAHDPRLGLSLLRSRAGLWRLPQVSAPVGAKVRMRIRARDVMLSLGAPVNISALNVLKATVAEIAAPVGPVVDLRLDCNGEALLTRLTRYSVERLQLAPGSAVHAVIKSVALDRRGIGGPARDGADHDAVDA